MSKKQTFSCALVVLLTLLLQPVWAQQFRYKAPLGPAANAGFYKITLPPQIVAHCKTNLADIRIKDAKGNAVPYIVKTDAPVFQEAAFIELPIISNQKDSDKQTHIVVRNQPNQPLDYLLLMIKNTDARRLVSLSGSDDNQRWFAIKENISLESYFTNKGSFVQSLSFPPTNYQFFQVTILGKDVMPVNIIKCGIYKENFFEGRYVALPAPHIDQRDSSDNNSYVSLTFDQPYQIDKIDWGVTGPKYYKRTVAISVPGTNAAPFFTSFTSGGATGLPLGVRTAELLLVVNNQDNPPLRLRAVHAWQLNRYLLAYLEPGNAYHLFFSDSTVLPPKYDLAFFADSISKAVTTINVGSIVPVSAETPLQQKSSTARTIGLWIVIVCVLALLLRLTLQLTKEVPKHP